METSSNVFLGATKSDSPMQRRNYKQFQVQPSTFNKFQTGKSKYSRWSSFLDEEDETLGGEIKSYAQKNPSHTIVLQCSETGAMRQIRRKSSNGL